MEATSSGVCLVCGLGKQESVRKRAKARGVRMERACCGHVPDASFSRSEMDSRERFSATVDEYRQHRPDYPEALIDWVMSDAALSVGSLVIDVGCGTGISSRQLAQRGLRVIGVDPNDAMLAEARHAGESASLRYLKGDAETLALDETADGLVCAQALHWVDLDKALP